MGMTATFTKADGVPAVYRWPGGLVATTMPQSGTGLPHDLGHWILEAQVDLPWGFWSLAGQRAPFRSFTVVSGRWPKDRVAWLERVHRKHGPAMLHAEANGGGWLADPDLDVRASWTEIKRKYNKAYAFEPHALMGLHPHDVDALRPLAQRTVALWDGLAAGRALRVTWPGKADPVEAAGERLVA